MKPNEVVEALLSMSVDDQAMFFNYLDEFHYADEFNNLMKQISKSNFLHDGGRWVMGRIGHYAN